MQLYSIIFPTLFAFGLAFGREVNFASFQKELMPPNLQNNNAEQAVASDGHKPPPSSYDYPHGHPWGSPAAAGTQRGVA